MVDRIKADVPDSIIVSDQSSVLGARDHHKEDLWSGYDVIFSGAHKNLGTSGLTFVIIKDEVMDKIKFNKKSATVNIPKLMDWTNYSELDYVNTPTMLSVYLSAETCSHYNKMGGIEYYEDLAVKRAEVVYDALDSSNIFKNSIYPELRSTMN